jgi:hypothetical protein
MVGGKDVLLPSRAINKHGKKKLIKLAGVEKVNWRVRWKD